MSDSDSARYYLADRYDDEQVQKQPRGWLVDVAPPYYRVRFKETDGGWRSYLVPTGTGPNVSIPDQEDEPVESLSDLCGLVDIEIERRFKDRIQDLQSARFDFRSSYSNQPCDDPKMWVVEGDNFDLVVYTEDNNALKVHGTVAPLFDSLDEEKIQSIGGSIREEVINSMPEKTND
jgi:hypothetical protein